MSIDFVPTHSKEIFVGRVEEIGLFREVLEGKRPEWIIQFRADGGSGKTRLLEKFREIAVAAPKVLVTGRLLDFYDAANNTGFGFLTNAAHQFGRDHFRKFFSERREFEKLLSTSPDPVERQAAVQRVTDAFLQDYEELLAQGFRVVWLLDTCEQMGSVRDYLVQTLLPKIRALEEALCADAGFPVGAGVDRKTTVVLVGRKAVALPPFPGECLDRTLGELSKEDVRSFFASQSGMRIGGSAAAYIEKLHEKTKGRPMYVALSHDWLANEIGTWDELLSLGEPFGSRLVSWVGRLDALEKQSILCAALAWRRVEPALLGKLLGISEKKAAEVLRRDGRFSFVKYRPPEDGFRGAYQLHDEMRDLIVRYQFEREGVEWKENSYAVIVDWYEEQITKMGGAGLLTGEKLPADCGDEQDTLRAWLAEWLYYRCELGLADAYQRYERIFRKAVHFMDLAFCELLAQEIRRFDARLSQQDQDMLQFQEALVLFRREKNLEAREVWHSLVRVASDQRLRATALMQLVELDSYIGKADEAIEHAREADKIFGSLIRRARGSQEKQRLREERGYLYNNWGYAYRTKGEYALALAHYEKARDAGGLPKNMARTLNNMGYIHFLLGDPDLAVTYVGRAMQMRRSFKPPIPYELGLSYNTMGIIMEQSGRSDEPADLYYKALMAFTEARSERGKALALVSLGRLHRRVNQFEEAWRELSQARLIFEQKPEPENLIAVLNELGCVLRQRGSEGDWEEAERLYRESLRLCKEQKKVFEEADNWDDLCILYVREFNKARQLSDRRLMEKFTQAARDAADRADQIAKAESKKSLQAGKRHGYTYLRAKQERSLGDLDYGREDYVSAFEHYFVACRHMVKAFHEGGASPVLANRRLDEMTDRLQAQLQALPDEQDISAHVKRLKRKIARLPEDEREGLTRLSHHLDNADELARALKGVKH